MRWVARRLVASEMGDCLIILRLFGNRFEKSMVGSRISARFESVVYGAKKQWSVRKFNDRVIV